jgi:hypothetical protein
VVVVYLPKVIKSGPDDGSCPAPVAVEERSTELPPLERTRALEHRLIATHYQYPQGDGLINGGNRSKLKDTLRPLLVDKDAALAITGGEAYCSGNCTDEPYKGYKFLDSGRFKLHSCVHHSFHLQCFITYFICADITWTWCPIHDTPECRQTMDDQGKKGQAHHWAPEDYHNFIKAFLRSEKLVDAFIKPEALLS